MIFWWTWCNFTHFLLYIHPSSACPKHLVPPTCCGNQTTFTRAELQWRSQVSAREAGVWHQPSYFSDVRYKLSEEQEVKRQKTPKASQRERWEPFRAKVSAEPSAPCTASAAAPWVHSARPASPSQPSSSSPYQSAKVSQSAYFLISRFIPN